MASSPHDALFKACFTQPDLARSELELVLPKDVRAQLDLGTLIVRPGSFVDEELQQTHSDVLYAVRTRAGNEGLVYVVLEHQSSQDPTMAFRLLKYAVRIWERWLRDHPGVRTLPIILPVLLHHGDGAWRAAPEFASMFEETPDLIEATRPFVPHFRYVLDDLAALSATALNARPLDGLSRLVQLALWASRSFPRLQDAVPAMKAIVGTLVRDARARTLLSQFFTYVLSTAPPDVEERVIRSILLDVAGPEGQEDVVNAAEQLIEQGRAEGEARGLRTAIEAVLLARGVALSEFGRARISTRAEVSVLTRWLERAATVGSESEIFAGDDAP